MASERDKIMSTYFAMEINLLPDHNYVLAYGMSIKIAPKGKGADIPRAWLYNYYPIYTENPCYVYMIYFIIDIS